MASASRVGFVSIGGKVGERLYTFEWFMGLSLSQKQRCIKSFHDAIRKTGVKKVLEISSKSENEVGVKLSAFNLMLEIDGVKNSVENYYHSAKVFDRTVQFLECLNMSSRESKKYVNQMVEDKKLRLTGFKFNGIEFDIDTKSLCYDYIYILALTQNEKLSEEILKYDCFTDIVYNQNKGVACQARTCALFKYLKNKGLVDKFIENPYDFGYIYKNMYKFE